MANVKQVSSSGISFGGLLTLVFVTAKLWGKIDWSWWWVTSPLWAPVLVVLGLCAVFAVIAGLLWCVGSIAETVQRNRRLRRAAARVEKR